MLHQRGWFVEVCGVLAIVVVFGSVVGCHTIYLVCSIASGFDVDKLLSLTVRNESSVPIEIYVLFPNRMAGESITPSKEAYRGYLASGESWTWGKDDGPLYKVGTKGKPNGLYLRYRPVFEPDEWHEAQFSRDKHIAVLFSDGDDGLDVIAEGHDGRILKMFVPGKDLLDEGR